MTVKENYYPITLAFPGGSGSKSVCLTMQETQVRSPVGKILEEVMATFFSGIPMDRGA